MPIKSILLVFKLLMFKFVELLASQKSSFSIFPVLKRLNKIKKKKNFYNLLNLSVNHFPSRFKKIQISFWFFTETLTLLLLVLCWVGNNT